MGNDHIVPESIHVKSKEIYLDEKQELELEAEILAEMEEI